jgi:hypothetical protein
VTKEDEKEDSRKEDIEKEVEEVSTSLKKTLS